MEICRRLAGYSYGHADIVRRAMAKKKHDVMLKERESFVGGAVSNGVTAETANEIFDEMVSFASYAFNKSHAAAYAYLSYQTAYLKCHYHGEYMASLMSSVMSNTAKLAEYISMCRANGTEIIKPDVNRSMKGFAYCEGKMYFGLLAIKNAGSGLADRIIAEREKNGLYKSFQSFCERLEGRDLNKKSLENMIKAGCFDNLGLNRRQLLENYETILSSVSAGARETMEGQLNLFGGTDTAESEMRIPFKPEFPEKQLLRMEKEAAGMYLSGSPLSEHRYLSELLRVKSVREILSMSENTALKDGDSVSIICILQEIKLHSTRKGDKMCFITVSDDSGELEAVVFPDLFVISASKLKEDSVLLINGKISVKDESVTLVCGSITDEIGFSRMSENHKLCIKLTTAELVKTEQLKRLSAMHSGYTETCFYLTDARKMVSPKNKISLGISAELYGELLKIFGKDRLGLIKKSV